MLLVIQEIFEESLALAARRAAVMTTITVTVIIVAAVAVVAVVATIPTVLIVVIVAAGLIPAFALAVIPTVPVTIAIIIPAVVIISSPVIVPAVVVPPLVIVAVIMAPVVIIAEEATEHPAQATLLRAGVTLVLPVAVEHIEEIVHGRWVLSRRPGRAGKHNTLAASMSWMSQGLTSQAVGLAAETGVETPHELSASARSGGEPERGYSPCCDHDSGTGTPARIPDYRRFVANVTLASGVRYEQGG